MRLIEPNHLAGARVPRDALAKLTGAQAVAGFPFKLDVLAPAVVFHFGFVLGLKDVLPRKIQAVAVVAHVEHTLLGEARADARADACVYAAAVSDRRLATCLCRQHALEVDLQRPLERVRHLVMQRDAELGWIFRRRVDSSTHLRPRSRPVTVFQQLTGLSCRPDCRFEVPHLEPTKQYRSVPLEIFAE